MRHRTATRETLATASSVDGTEHVRSIRVSTHGVARLDTSWPTISPRRDRRRRPVPVLVRRRRRARLQRDPRARPSRATCASSAAATPGLWTAIIAKERDPSRDVVLIERATVGSAASGRNGGFMESSLTHGVANGQERFPDEMRVLEQLGLRNLNEIEAAIATYAIDCDYERTGVIDVATAAHTSVPRRAARRLRPAPPRSARTWRCSTPTRCEPRSTRRPTPAGCGARTAAAIVDPARLVWGLKAAAESLGVRIYEDTKATDLSATASACWSPPRSARPRRPGGARHERVHAAAATASALHRAGLRLLHGDRAADARTAGVDRLAQPPGPVRPSPTSSTTTGSPRTTGSCGVATTPSTTSAARSTPSSRAARDVGQAEPSTSSRPSRSSEGVKFTHMWGGAIDTSTRFCVFWGTADEGPGRVRPRLHRPRRVARPVRRRGDARPARRPPLGSHRPSSCASGRCRSRPSRSASSASRPPAGRSTATTPARPTQPLAPEPRPAGPRLRQLTGLRRLDRPSRTALRRPVTLGACADPARVGRRRRCCPRPARLPARRGPGHGRLPGAAPPPAAAARGRGRRRQDRGRQGASPLDGRRADPPAVLRGHRRRPGRLRVGLRPPAPAPAGRRGHRRGHRRPAPTSSRTSSTQSGSSSSGRCCGRSTTATVRRRSC